MSRITGFCSIIAACFISWAGVRACSARVNHPARSRSCCKRATAGRLQPGQTGRPGVICRQPHRFAPFGQLFGGAAVHLGAKTRPFPLRHPATPAGAPRYKTPACMGRLPGYRPAYRCSAPGARGRTRSMKGSCSSWKMVNITHLVCKMHCFLSEHGGSEP